MDNKKSKKEGKITIDKLAVMVAKGFENMATKDDLKNLETRINGKFKGVEKKIENVKDRLEGTNKRIDDFAETKASKITYKELGNRVDFIEKKLEINPVK